jgi:RHS repeat-associated protein
MKVSRPVRIAFLFLSAFLFQADKFMAVAATVPPGACLYALDPTADRAFQIAGAQSVNTACGVVVESSASDGFEMEGSETLYLQNHAQVSVVGGAQLNGQTELWDTISNKQVQAVQTSSPGDPLASIAAPTSGTVVSKSPAYFDMNAKPANNTFAPGVYCGGLTIGNTNGTAFTMSPGTYIMAGGGLVMNSQAVVKGTGVTVYNTSSAGWGCASSYSYKPVTISGQVTATLSAPTAGAFDGILFFGNRTGCSTKGSCVDQINGGSTTVLNGALYFASDEIEITGSNASGYMMLVADKIYINGISTFGNNGNPFDNITVSVSPATATLYAGQTQQFTATVNNTANTAVTWSISPAGVGSISSSGLYTAPTAVTAQQMVTVTATSQADTSKSATATVTLAVAKTTPTITWATPTAITYGTALSGAQLDATTSVAGTFVYSPAAGTVLAAGTHTLTVTFTPTDTTDYNSTAATVTLTVNKAAPTITWTTPVAITYGTALSGAQLDATASVPGTLVYTPAAGAVLTAGTQVLSVAFTPTDTTNYNTAAASITLTVNQATPAITWATPAAVTYGTALSTTQLDATASVSGTLVYTPAAGTVLTAGTQTLSVTFTPTDTTDYTTATATVQQAVNQAIPIITWATPAAITYGTALSGTQLDATASVPGTMVYTPAAGAVLTAGTQTLSVTFTPTDTTDYSSAAASVSLTVTNLPISVSITPPSATLFGGQTQQFTASVVNSSNQTVVWTIIPAGVGTIDATGLYTAPVTISVQQTVTITATSLADTTQSASAAVSLSPAQCATNGYSYQRAIVIDHTKVPNTDQVNFPFLFNTTDSLLATTANGGHVTSSNGYDIIFTSDAAGQNILNFEMEQYNPATGQVVSWVGIPTLSHTTDTVLYMFYGNYSITTSQQNPTAVWDSNYLGVYHLAGVEIGTAADSTVNGNNAPLNSVSAATGEIDGAASFNGASSYMQMPSADFASYLTSGSTTTGFTASFGEWFKTAAAGVLLSQDDRTKPGSSPSGWVPALYVDTAGSLRASMFWHGSSSNQIVTTTAYNDNKWHFVVDTYANGTETLYVDGQNTGSQQETENGYESLYSYFIGTGETSGWPAANGTWLYFNGSLDEISVSNIARSADWIATEYNSQGSPSTFYTLYPENSIEVIPATVNLYAGQSQQFSAAGACGGGIAWSMPSGAQGTLTASGLYTAPASIATQQSVAITASSQGTGEFTGSSIVTLLPAPLNLALSLAAAAQPPYVTGTSQTFTATLNNGSGTPISGEAVIFTFSGANNGSGSGTTDSNGVASYTYTGANSGTDSIQATASVSSGEVTSNTVSAVWIVPAQVVSATTVVGEFFLSDGSGVFDTLPSATPVFVQEFPVINFNPPAGTIPGTPSGLDDNTRPFTDVTTDLNGNFTGTIVAQGNGYQAGVGPMEAFQAVFRGTFTVASAGSVVFNFFSDDGFILGVSNGATRVSGASVNMPSVTPFDQYPVMGAVNGPNAADGNQIVVNFPTAGSYPYELDYSECCGGQLSITMTTSTASSGGVPPTGSLTLTPNTVQPLPMGGKQSFTVLASDASGAPVPNAGIGLVVSGVDNLQLSGITDATGHATILYQDVNPGTALVQGVAFISGMISYSNVVSVPWTLPAATTTTTGGSSTLSVSISALSSVTLPNALTLTGTVTDSTGLTPTLGWSQVSGPGTVTFTTPQQAVTTATFSVAGSYVLELSASDTSGNGGSVQWPVTVILPETDQGWVGSPVYGSAVSGVVPITVATGVTLAGGTLTFYPTSTPNNVTILNGNTTGSGQIGTLDTTTLPNGTYWIQLQATNTSGNVEYSLVQVTVTGNYKPGRVTATVTDLVVPATGLAINIQRTYDSLNAGTSGDFGYGWNLGINTNLTVDSAGNVTFTLGGQRKTFYLTPQYGGWLFPWYFSSYTPEPGLHGTLSDGGTGCILGDLGLLLPDGSLWYCITGAQYNPSSYIYTDPNGTSYTISAGGALQSIQDRSGNGLTITANGITSTTGLSVPFVRDAKNRITQITDPHGNVYLYGYDANGNLATVTYPNTAQPSTYAYDANHLYLTGTDARTNPLPVTAYYTSTDTDPNGLPLNGRLQSVTNAAGQTSYAYNLLTNTTTITYPDNGKATMVYDSYGDLLTSTDPLGNTTTNVYDAKHNLISVTDSLGHTTTSTYDANGNKTSSTYPATSTNKNTTSYNYYNQYSEPTSTTDELGNVRTFNYDANYNPQSVTDASGTLASFIFNANSTLEAGTIGFDISTSPAMASQFTYDANGNMVSRTDALGRTTSYTYNSLGQKTAMVAPTPTILTGGPSSTTTYQYDALGNLVQTAAPLSRTTGSTYDANGNKISDTDARGNVTTYQYDALNRLTTTTYSDKTTSSKSYDFRNNVVTSTDQAGNITQNAYDLAGRLTSVTRGYGTSSASTTSYTYDSAGHKISETDALGHTTSYTYDAAGRLTAVSGVKGNTTYGYDDAGNQTSRTDGNGNTTTFQYDARKRLIKTTYPDKTTVVNSYDGPGNLASVTDQNGNVVQYTYDAANQLKTVVQVNHPNPSNNTNLYGYDNLGNLTGLTDENLHTTVNGFDVLNESITKILPDATHTESRQYDTAGNLISLTHFNGVTTTYTYDALNRMLSRTTPGESPVSFSYTPTGKYLTSTAADGTVNYAYDALDRLTTKATPEGTLNYTYDVAGHVETIVSSNPNGASVAYTYDDLNRLQTVVDNRLPGQNTTTYTYDPASNVATVAYPNGLQSNFTYDALNRLTEMITPVSGYSYTLGATGNRTQAVEINGRTINWNYDGIYRLTSETISDDPAKNNGSVAYGLDPVGNRQSETSTLSGLSSGSFTYNADDQISSETYDANGNTLTAGGKSYTYDSENHMTSMTGNGTVVTMVYDAFGNRVAKTVNGVTTKYLVEDDVNPTGLPQVLEETVNGAVQRVYTYGLQRISEYQVVSNAWTASFYGYDGAGSVRQLTDSTGKVTDEYEYDAYGNSFTKTGTTPNNYLYRGEQYDSDLGLYYLRARYYNPNTGRFMSRDPYDGDTKIPATLHKYFYAGGDPVNLKDPTGRDWLEYKLLLIELVPPAVEGLMIAAKVVCTEFAVVAFVLDGSHWLNPSSPGLPWPVKAPCAAFGIGTAGYAAVMALIAAL